MNLFVFLPTLLLNAGNYIGPVTGNLVDVFPPWINFVIARISTSGGYFVASILISHGYTPVELGMSFFFVGFGGGLMYVTSLACNVRNFAEQEAAFPVVDSNGKTTSRRGVVVGFLESFFGFAAILTSGIYQLIGSPVRFCGLWLLFSHVIVHLASSWSSDVTLL
jgi:MFS family permease